MTILPFTPQEYSFTKTKHSMYCLIIYLDLVNLYGKCRCLYVYIYTNYIPTIHGVFGTTKCFLLDFSAIRQRMSRNLKGSMQSINFYKWRWGFEGVEFPSNPLNHGGVGKVRVTG